MVHLNGFDKRQDTSFNVFEMVVVVMNKFDSMQTSFLHLYFFVFQVFVELDRIIHLNEYKTRETLQRWAEILDVFARSGHIQPVQLLGKPRADALDTIKGTCEGYHTPIELKVNTGSPLTCLAELYSYIARYQ